MIIKKELKAIYSNQRSFYGKSEVEEVYFGGGLLDEVNLFSYNTKVATIENGKLTYVNYYSLTTGKHIKEFLQQYINILEEETRKKLINKNFSKKVVEEMVANV